MDTISVTLTESQRRELVVHYQSEIRKLDAKKREFIDLIEKLTPESRLLPKDRKQLHFNEQIKSNEEYDPEWAWTQKLIYVLSKQTKALTAREIFDRILTLEPSLKENERVQFQYLASNIANMAQVGKIIGRFKENPTDQYKIGLKHWFDGDESLLPQYR